MSDLDSEEFQEVMLLELSERISELDKGVLKLEKDPGDKILIEDLMRTLHNLKGLFGLAGYQQISTLTHSMENIVTNLDVRNLTKITKLLFKYSDELKKLSKALKQGSTPDLLSFDEITQSMASFDELMIRLGNSLRIQINFDLNCKVVSSRSMVLLKRLQDHATIDRTYPPQDEIEEGMEFHELTIEITTREDEDTIESICGDIQDVTSVNVSRLLDSVSTVDIKGVKVEEAPELLTVRVNIGALDNIIELLGDLVVYGQFLREIGQQHVYSREIRENLANFERSISNIQDLIIRMRLVPLETILNRFPRMVRDISAKEGKRVDFIMTGKHIGVDRSVIEHLVDPLSHLLRNAVSHGIESPDERTKIGKDPIGVINLSVSHERSDIIVEIRDNGRGLDYDKIREHAKETGLYEDIDGLSEQDLHKFILTNTFSTTEEASEISGRGVGLVAVKQAIDSIGGTIELDSELGKYSSFRLIIPLSVAIMKVLMLSVKNHQFALPMANIVQILSVPHDKILVGDNVSSKSIVVDNNSVPLVDLRDRLEFHHQERLDTLDSSLKDEIVILWRKGNRSIGFVVDELQGERDIVMKPISNFLGQIGAFSGATVLEGGKVVLIIDPTSFTEVELFA